MTWINRNHVVFFLLLLILMSGRTAYCWFDKTHIAAAKAAGYDRWYNAAAPDVARVKAGSIEGNNHYYNNPGDITITPESVIEQAERYNNPKDKKGHMYGAIIASLREYIKHYRTGNYAHLHLAYFVHYVGDLSQPLHNMPNDNFNNTRHLINDGIVNREVLGNIGSIASHMYRIDLQHKNLEYAVAKETARLANQARTLGNRLKKEQRNMTKEEVYIQLGHSASLMKAVIKQLEKL